MKEDYKARNIEDMSAGAAANGAASGTGQDQTAWQGEFEDLGFAKIDMSRQARVGYPEVIYGAGKTKEQVATIMETMAAKKVPCLVTRVCKHMAHHIIGKFPEVKYNTLGRTLFLPQGEVTMTESHIAIVTAGTSDMPVAEEAAVTCEAFGNKVDRIYDVGVAGIHRLLSQVERIRSAKVIIVIAGMEGALASVVGGLVQVPVVAVPTSVGYGANLQGLTALLSMLNSCASGVTVVNIDNGFGAAYFASMINKL